MAPLAVAAATAESPGSQSSHPENPEFAFDGADGSVFRSAVAGNPEALDALAPLPASREEVESLATLFSDSRLLIGPDASEQNLTLLASERQLSRFGVLHFATHALVDDERPLRSVLALSRRDLLDPLVAAESGSRIYDGLLSAQEILVEWRLEPELVTLSACETGLGREVQGEGYVGLTHAVMQAGARSLLVSLWPVEDRATALLMRRFYENWTGAHMERRGERRSGDAMGKAEALGEAKRWLREEYRNRDGARPYEHPYYWSAFILIGEAV